ncbi:MAG: sugar ABC transporter ATP-binding protein [Oscillospiraceae bacterium]|nr:sugar ABC transporter ATP-binding protein [Oscillospiraceae bacterium]
MAKSDYLLEMRHIQKSFGAVVALTNGCVRARSGEVNALIGGNGAGKSTLIKILSGYQPCDAGDILLNGEKVEIHSTTEAQDLGIKTIYQELALFEKMNVYENMYVGRELTIDKRPIKWLKVLDLKKMRENAQAEIKRMGFNIPNIFNRVMFMSGGQRQAIACAKALMGGAPSVLIMDEPTAALGVKEGREIIDLMKKYRDEGAAIILISHNMRTVFEVANEITVMRLGETIASLKKEDTNEEEVVGLMTGAIDNITDERNLIGEYDM